MANFSIQLFCKTTDISCFCKISIHKDKTREWTHFYYFPSLSFFLVKKRLCRRWVSSEQFFYKTVVNGCLCDYFEKFQKLHKKVYPKQYLCVKILFHEICLDYHWMVFDSISPTNSYQVIITNTFLLKYFLYSQFSCLIVSISVWCWY